MYYRLNEPWSFRGWKLAPYALRAETGEHALDRPRFVDKGLFLDLLYCNGEEPVDLADMDDEGASLIRKLVEEGIVGESADALPPLAPWQRYHVYPSRYIESAHWSITGKCNFKCRHCLVSAPDAHLPQLPLADILHIAHEITRCGIRRVDITGGEPLLRDDFEHIVEELAEGGVTIGVIFTNASLLSEGVLDMLERHGQHPVFQMSFDGLGHHNWLRGVPGAEAMADKAFRLLRERGFKAQAAMSIHRGNRGALRATANHLAELGVAALVLNAPQKLGAWRQYADEYALTEDEVWDVYRAYIPEYFADGMPIDIELDGYFFCKKGCTDYRVAYVHHPGDDPDWGKLPYCESMRYSMHIGPDGRVYPCMAFSESGIKDRFPSALERRLGDITLSGYYHDVVETKISDLLSANLECAQCEHLQECCGGCMVQDMTDEGNFLVPDSRCCWFFKNVGAAAVHAVADAAIQKVAPTANCGLPANGT